MKKKKKIIKKQKKMIKKQKKMRKINKMVSISHDIVEDLKEKNINFSKWIDFHYREKEMKIKSLNISEKEKELDKLRKIAGKYKTEEKEKQEKEKQELTEDKIKFLKNAYKRVKKGYDLNANYKFFCFEFGDIDYLKFKKYMEYYGSIE